MKHGIEFKIGNVKKHSLIDWGVFLSPFNIPSAEVKTNYVDKEGGTGSIDLTEVFGITYKDIKLNFTFTMKSGDYDKKLREIKAFLHGKKAQITTYRDDSYYYIGRCQVNEFKSSKARGTFSIDVFAEPYKYKQYVTVRTEQIVGEKEVIFLNDSMEVVPTFECDSDMSLEFKGNSYSIGSGSTVLPDILFGYGDNLIKFVGTGTVKVTYQEGAI